MPRDGSAAIMLDGSRIDGTYCALGDLLRFLGGARRMLADRQGPRAHRRKPDHGAPDQRAPGRIVEGPDRRRPREATRRRALSMGRVEPVGFRLLGLRSLRLRAGRAVAAAPPPAPGPA